MQNQKRQKSKEARRDIKGKGVSYGPGETEETMLFGQLKKQQTIDEVKNGLTDQIENQHNEKVIRARKQIHMEKHNLSKVLDIINNQAD